jgi:hypothetical protein
MERNLTPGPFALLLVLCGSELTEPVLVFSDIISPEHQGVIQAKPKDQQTWLSPEIRSHAT